MHLYLIRHATPSATVDNPGLSDLGRNEAIKLGQMFIRLGAPVDTTKVLTSELRRAHLTGKHIYSTLQLLRGRFDNFPAPTGPLDTQVQELMALLRSVAADGFLQHIIVVTHFGYVGAALNWLVGDDVLEWPPIYGATAHVECDNTFDQNTGHLRWFVFPGLLG